MNRSQPAANTALTGLEDPIEELASQFARDCNAAGASEQLVLDRLTKRLHVSHNTEEAFDDRLTLGQRMADRIALFGGSWTFIISFLSLLAAWIAINTIVLRHIGTPFDPYPFIFLNLVLSMLAALQAPVIMMSQNRHAAKDRAAAEHDYEVNLKAELEILALHRKLDQLRETQWAELVEMQQRQILLLTQLIEQPGKAPTPAAT